MQDFLSTVILLIIVIDPIGLAPMIHGMLKKYSPERRRVILIRELFFTLALLLIFFFSGQFLLDLLGLHRASLSISGGILLFLVALGMVFPAKDMLASANSSGEQDEPFIVPIAMPLMAGPSSLAIIMLYSAEAPDNTAKFIYTSAIITACLISGVILLLAQKFLKHLGEKGTLALEKMMGMVLILIAVQMFMNGITEYGRGDEPSAAQVSRVEACTSSACGKLS